MKKKLMRWRSKALDEDWERGVFGTWCWWSHWDKDAETAKTSQVIISVAADLKWKGDSMDAKEGIPGNHARAAHWSQHDEYGNETSNSLATYLNSTGLTSPTSCRGISWSPRRASNTSQHQILDSSHTGGALQNIQLQKKRWNRTLQHKKPAERPQAAALGWFQLK